MTLWSLGCRGRLALSLARALLDRGGFLSLLLCSSDEDTRMPDDGVSGAVVPRRISSVFLSCESPLLLGYCVNLEGSVLSPDRLWGCITSWPAAFGDQGPGGQFTSPCCPCSCDFGSLLPLPLSLVRFLCWEGGDSSVTFSSALSASQGPPLILVCTGDALGFEQNCSRFLSNSICLGNVGS